MKSEIKKLLIITGLTAGAIWLLKRKPGTAGVSYSGYMPRFHVKDKIVAATRLPTDTVYEITDLYYHSGEWMYSLNGEAGYLSREIDAACVPASTPTGGVG